jgi:SAM-dependent methyltransferase
MSVETEPRDQTMITSASRIGPLEATHFWFVGRDTLFTNLLDRIRPADDWHVGEIGFGTGRFAAELSARGVDVNAIDTEVHHPLPSGPSFAVAHGAHLPWRDQSLDLVLLRDVLEHGDDTSILDESHRVLRPEGHLLISVPAWPKLWSERDRVAGHLRRYTKRGLLSLLRTHGFEATEVRGYPFFLFPAFVVSRQRSRHVGADIRSEEAIHPTINAALRTITTLEANLALSRHLRPPLGSSLIVLAARR